MAEKKIGLSTYKIEPLLATAALVLFARVTKTIGPALPRLGDVMKGIGPQAPGEADSVYAARKNASAAAGFAAMNDIVAEADPVKMADLIKQLVELCMIKEGASYVPVEFDHHFTGNLGEAIKVVGFVLQEQFADFFPAGAATGARRQLAGG